MVVRHVMHLLDVIILLVIIPIIITLVVKNAEMDIMNLPQMNMFYARLKLTIVANAIIKMIIIKLKN